jgi:hypothetical protein
MKVEGMFVNALNQQIRFRRTRLHLFLEDVVEGVCIIMAHA